MKEVTLEAKLREEIGSSKSRALRNSGFIPAVVYGEGKSQAIKVSRSKFLKFLHEHKGENVIIRLKIDNEKKQKAHTVMIKEIQYDPVSEEIIHLDFNKISLTKAITVKVPVEVKGESPGVKMDGGSLEHVLWEIEVECLPKDMPKSIEVDVSNLKIGDAIHIKDITFPEGVTVKHEPEAIVLSVVPPAKEEVVVEEEALVEEETKEPEVIKEKKEKVSEEAKEEEAKPKEGKEEK
jgi:large subunit ribosomal protein L25